MQVPDRPLRQRGQSTSWNRAAITLLGDCMHYENAMESERTAEALQSLKALYAECDLVSA